MWMGRVQLFGGFAVFLVVLLASQAPALRAVSLIEAMDGVFAAKIQANVHAAPSSDAAQVTGVESGAMLHVTGRTRDTQWYRVELPDGRSGYVFAQLLEAIVIRKEPAAQAQTQTAAQPPAPALAPTPPPKPAPPPAPAVTQPTSEPATEVAALPPSPAAPVGDAFRDCPGCPEMVPLPPGSFVMGRNGGDPAEGPAHKVSLARGFALGRTEVTLGQWRACAAEAGCKLPARLSDAADDEPVRYLTHDDARAYIAWLSKKTGKDYRFPTEAEWEYAARAGTSSLFWWGDRVGEGRANCKDCGGVYDRKRPNPAGRGQANAFGLHDMSGGVAEWVGDCWFTSHQGAPADGALRDKSDCRQRVLRGGSWRNDSSALHSAARFFYDAAVPYSANGLRVALTLP